MDIGHHPAAVLLKNGAIVAMCEEERFVRSKEAPGLFPLNAIQFCLARPGLVGAGDRQPCHRSLGYVWVTSYQGGTGRVCLWRRVSGVGWQQSDERRWHW